MPLLDLMGMYVGMKGHTSSFTPPHWGHVFCLRPHLLLGLFHGWKRGAAAWPTPADRQLSSLCRGHMGMGASLGARLILSSASQAQAGSAAVWSLRRR